ncbi:hypothetical protein BJH93_11075 [Kocuria polaris]|nr:hypothetical protein [Kocuria polaris]
MQLLKSRGTPATAYVVHRHVEVNDPEVDGSYTPIIGVFLTKDEAVSVEQQNPQAGIEWTELPVGSLRHGDSPSMLYLGVEVGPWPEGVLVDPTPRAAFADREAALRWAEHPGSRVSRAHALAVPVGQLDWDGRSWNIL